MLHAPTSDTKQQADLGRANAPGQELSRSKTPPLSPRQRRTAQWQRAFGNRATLRMLSLPSPAVQAKLTIDQPGDAYEQKADRVADQVMRMSDAHTALSHAPLWISLKCSACEEEDKQKLQMESASGGDIAGREALVTLHERLQPLRANVIGDKALTVSLPSRQIAINDESATEDTFDGGASVAGATPAPAQCKNSTDASASEVDETSQLGTESRPYLCANGGGSSSCHVDSGKYEVDSNDNTCCTRDCTQQHELQHVKDYTAWGCCRKAADAFGKSARPEKVVSMYNAWLEEARPLSECNAYRNDVKCATAMYNAKDCGGKGKNSDCCSDISSYKNKYSEKAADYCGKAPSKAPPCPNFDLATLLP